jgi:hypothetical protein
MGLFGSSVLLGVGLDSCVVWTWRFNNPLIRRLIYPQLKEVRARVMPGYIASRFGCEDVLHGTICNEDRFTLGRAGNDLTPGIDDAAISGGRIGPLLV